MAAKPACSYAINTYSYTLDHGAAGCLSHLADQGYTEFELMMYPGHIWPLDSARATRDALAALLAERGLRIHTLNQPNVDLNLAAATPEMRAYTLAVIRATVELAGELGAPGVVIGPGKYNPLFPAPRERLTGWFHEALDDLVPLAKRAGTKILVENMPFAFLPGAGELMEALQGYDIAEVGVVYDIANAAFVREDIAEGLRLTGPRLEMVHVSDTGREVYRHDPVGQGTIDFRAVGAQLQEAGYRGPLVLEIISRSPDGDFRESIQALAEAGWEGLTG